MGFIIGYLIQLFNGSVAERPKATSCNLVQPLVKIQSLSPSLNFNSKGVSMRMDKSDAEKSNVPMVQIIIVIIVVALIAFFRWG